MHGNAIYSLPTHYTIDKLEYRKVQLWLHQFFKVGIGIKAIHIVSKSFMAECVEVLDSVITK